MKPARCTTPAKSAPFHPRSPRHPVSLSSILLLFTLATAQTGTVLDNETNEPLQNALVSLKSTGALVLTDAEGKFEFTGSAVTSRRVSPVSSLPVTFKRNAIQFTITELNTRVNVKLFTSNGRMVKNVAEGAFQPGTHTVPLSLSTANFWIAAITIGNTSIVTPIITHSPTHPISFSPPPRLSDSPNLRLIH